MAVDIKEVRAWTARDSVELYNVEAWGDGYFTINNEGNVLVRPSGPSGRSIDLKALVDDLRRRGTRLPVLIRFSEILADRVKRLFESFRKAIAECNYQGPYRGVYPIKVNQERLIVEELVRYGKSFGLGLEAGSKPELLIALALQDNPDAYIICNGYKDSEYMRLAMLSQKLGRKIIIVLDRFAEIYNIMAVSKELGLRPMIGVRCQLTTRGAGRWAESTGDRSKFGLSSLELMQLIDVMRSNDMLDCFKMLHFHIGSQITAVRAIKSALAESSRVFVELHRLGAPLQFIDVGGGLAVDYDGSHTNFQSSSNYTVDEYAADVVSAIAEACNTAQVPHPTIISESGRALTAHHSVLIFDVLGIRETPSGEAPPVESGEHRVLVDLASSCNSVNRKNFQEIYHDILQLRDEAETLFKVGVFDLSAKARAEQLFWLTCRRINKITQGLDYVPDELESLTKTLSDIYYCNFSVFQSVPDHWACKQLFPTLPIHRLNERPTRLGTLADLTCDSDGKVDQFIDLHDVKDVLELHEVKPGDDYIIGMFLVGAYQEILGDLHNLFGDTHCIHVSMSEAASGGYIINDIEEGETIQEVLLSVSYDRKNLVNAVRKSAERAIDAGRLSLEAARDLLRQYEASMSNYTYLHEDDMHSGGF
jgi:arginine decarboxylase